MKANFSFPFIFALAALGLSGCFDMPVPMDFIDGPVCSEYIIKITASGEEIKTNRCQITQYCANEDGVKSSTGSCLDAGEKCVGSEGLGNDNDFGYCLPGATCLNGKCSACAEGQIICGGNCVNPKNDRFWCGAKDNCIGENSGKKCADGEVCADGVCDTSCPGGQTICTTENGSTCVDIQSDPNNCGDCGNRCPKGNACIEGECSASCLEGQELCGSACVILSSDPNNCGECGNKCPSGNACVEGKCSADCLEGQELCGNACVILSSDPNNCGECGNKCPVGYVCVEGSCSASCLESQVLCGGKCIDPKSDASYCGAAVGGTCDSEDSADSNYKGKVCVSGEICANGECLLSCQDGLIECNGICANPKSDKDNCGTCGTKCSEYAQLCVDGQCACPSGYTLCEGEGCVDLVASHRSACQKCIDSSWGDCDNNWKTGCETNLMTSNANCEACGHECSAGTFCSNGFCSATCGGDLTECTVDDIDGCYNLSNDAHHCGACNKACPSKSHATASCSDSQCIYTCESGYTNCGTPSEPNCLNLNTDGDNCGVCNNKCANLPNVSGGSCSGGVCQISCQVGFADCNSSSTDGCEAKLSETNRTACQTCASNYANCDGNWNNGCEINIKSDNANCGACSKNNDHKCESGKVCSSGICSASCLANQQLCGSSCLTLADMHLSNCNTCAANYCDSDNNKINGCEVQKGTSVDHCTACNTACPSQTNATALCNGGTCTYICNLGYTNCGSDTAPNCIKVTGNGANDANNCGYCGYKCTDKLANVSSATCVNGVCTFSTCDSNYASCDGSDANGCEVNSKSDQTHCGASDKCNGNKSGTNCTGGRVCSNGSCVCAVSGQVFCNGKCIDPKTDATYCGASGNCTGNNAGNTCSGGKSCDNGSCKCQDGLTYCKINNSEYVCADPKTSKQYCGCTTSSAGTACGNGQACVNGQCKGVDCSNNQCYVTNACVTNTNNKGCGPNCYDCTAAGGSGLHSTNGTCSSGQCVASACETGYCAKDGVCASNTLATSCGAKCIDCSSTGRICSSGNCICPDNKVYCKTGNNTYACIDPSKDNEFCGCTNNSVGNNCDEVPHSTVGACKNNSCTVACESGYHQCERQTACCDDNACGDGQVLCDNDSKCCMLYKNYTFESGLSNEITKSGNIYLYWRNNGGFQDMVISNIPTSYGSYIQFYPGNIGGSNAWLDFEISKPTEDFDISYSIINKIGLNNTVYSTSGKVPSTTPTRVGPYSISKSALKDLVIEIHFRSSTNSQVAFIDNIRVYGY